MNLQIFHQNLTLPPIIVAPMLEIPSLHVFVALVIDIEEPPLLDDKIRREIVDVQPRGVHPPFSGSYRRLRVQPLPFGECL